MGDRSESRGPSAAQGERATWVRCGGTLVAMLAGLAILPASLMAFTTVFFFDAPGSEESPLTWLAAAAFWCAPVLLAFAAREGSWASRTEAVPRLWRALTLLAAPAIVGGALLLLQLVCKGASDCAG
jgi:hypothetical protein